MNTQTSKDGPDAAFDKAGQDEIEGRTGPTEGTAAPPELAPAAGPHAQPSLTNTEATPGAGSLPSPTPDDDADAATG